MGVWVRVCVWVCGWVWVWVCTRRYVLLSAVACSLLFHVNAAYTVQYLCQLDSDIELPGLLSVPSRSIKLGQCRLQFLAKAQTIGDCGRRIRISVCSPSLYYKTSKPQIQQQGAQGDLRGTFRCGACYVLPATRPDCELPSWSLSLWSAERSRYKSQTSCLATLEGRSVL